MMSPEEVKVVKWVEWILAPILVISVLALGRCTASAQDELIILQRDVALGVKVHDETNAAIKEIQRDVNATKVVISAMRADQRNNEKRINTIHIQNTEIIRLLREK